MTHCVMTQHPHDVHFLQSSLFHSGDVRRMKIDQQQVACFPDLVLEGSDVLMQARSVGKSLEGVYFGRHSFFLSQLFLFREIPIFADVVLLHYLLPSAWLWPATFKVRWHFCVITF